MSVESFTTTPLARVLPSYAYAQYQDDADIAAFIGAYNALAQSYLDWFNGTPLAVYTSPNVTGDLLDWTATGIYGIPRPTLSTVATISTAGINAFALNTVAVDGAQFLQSGTAAPASDDIYKRYLTWLLYRGDGIVFNAQWLRNRVNRFLNGANGADADVLDNPPSVVMTGGTTTITVEDTGSTAYSDLQLLYGSGYLPVPIGFTLSFETGTP